MKRLRTLKELAEGMEDARQWVEWERESMELFHAYAQRFDGRPGSNVFLHVLGDALRYHGLTLEQFKERVEASR